MWGEILTAGISGITAIIVAYLGISQTRDKQAREKRQANIDEREKLREDREMLTLDYIDANAKAIIACSVAIVDGKTNGEMHSAISAVENAKDNYARFLKREGIKTILN